MEKRRGWVGWGGGRGDIWNRHHNHGMLQHAITLECGTGVGRVYNVWSTHVTTNTDYMN